MVATMTRYAHPTLAPLNAAIGRLRHTIDAKMWATAGLWDAEHDPTRQGMPTYYEPGTGIVVADEFCVVIESATGCGAIARKQSGRRELITLVPEKDLIGKGPRFIEKVVASIDARIS